MSGILQTFHGNGFIPNDYGQSQQQQQPPPQQSQHYPIAGPSQHQSLPLQHQPSFEHLTSPINGHIPQPIYLQQGNIPVPNHFPNGLQAQAHFPPNAIAGPSYTHPGFLPGHMSGPQDAYHFGAPMPPPQAAWNGNPMWDDLDGDLRDGNEVIYGTLEVSSKSPISAPQFLNDRDSNRFPSIPPPSSPRVGGTPRSVSSSVGSRSGSLQLNLDLKNLKTPPSTTDLAPTKVKHRRRTTPEQLKVLEHWFDVNPKPDNNLREWLAHELGMTKRNVQVWFQNRRAKLKGVALKEKAAMAKAASDANRGESATTPENRPSTPPNSAPTLIASKATPSPEDQNQIPLHRDLRENTAYQQPHRPPPLHIQSQPHMQSELPVGLLPPVHGVNMGRRVSLANGEAAKIEVFLAKQRMAARKASIGVGHNIARQSGFVSPVRSPVIPQNQASLARRGSIPYPSPIEGPLSPKISPSVRPMSSALHLAALRNNSRRASMPGVAQVQLISSGPFTPPRVVSSGHQNGAPGASRMTRELSPIKDQDGEHSQMEGQQQQQQDGTYMYSEADLSTTYLTPPSSTYLPNTSPTSYLHPDTSSTTYDYNGDQSQQPFTPAGPLPNPSFSFGSAPSSQVPQIQMDDPNSVAMWMDMQNRGRLGSIASINTVTTADGSDWGSDLAGLQGGMDMNGFDPDTRRASAPADLLHDLGILGINSNLSLMKNAVPLRPSPLGSGGMPQGAFQSFDMNQSYSNNSNGDAFLLPNGQMLDLSNPGSDNSPPSGSSSEGPSPSPRHQGQAPYGQGQDGKQHLTLSTSNLHPPPLYPESMSGGSASTSVSPFSSSISTSNGFVQQAGMNRWSTIDNTNINGVQNANGSHSSMSGFYGVENQHNMENLSGGSIGLEDVDKEEFAFFADLSGDPINVLV